MIANDPDVRVGKPGGGAGDPTDTAPDDADDTAIDTSGEGGEGGEGGAEDTGPVEGGGEVTGEVCYLGPDEDDAACFPVVDYDPSWGSDYDYPEPYGGSAQYAKPARYLDLTSLDGAEPVAPNFVIDELMQAVKGPYGLFQTHVVVALQDIRDATGGPLTVNSGYRNVAYNAGVGGATYSRHMYGDAVDIASDMVGLEALGDLCGGADASFVLLYEAHVHCDWRDEPLDPAFYDPGRARRTSPEPLLSAEIERVGGLWAAPAEGFDEGEPLRRWAAWDASGALVADEVGELFAPPDGAVRVEVVVGGRVRVARRL